MTDKTLIIYWSESNVFPNCLLAGDSHEISYLIFWKYGKKMLLNLLSAVVMNGALRINIQGVH